jgi:hypothetical protein
MKLSQVTRRSLVTAGVAIGLLGGGVAIRTAADAASAVSSTAVSPLSIDVLAARIGAEQTRSAALRAQIEQLSRDSDQLAAALAMANRMAGDDELSADTLRAELLDAKAHLAAIEPPAAAAGPSTAARRTSTTTRTTASLAPAGEDEDDEHDDDEHDDDEHDDDHDDGHDD